MIDTYSDVLNQTNPFNPSKSLENNVNKYSKYSRAREHKYEKKFEALIIDFFSSKNNNKTLR